jgi:hypothetical protein
MVIDNSKFIITNEVVVDKYDLMIQADVTGVPAILQIQKANYGIVFIGHYASLKFFIDGDKLVILDNNFYGEFSVNNVDGFNTAQDLLISIKSGIN